MAKTIPLTRGKVALVDDADHTWLSQWKWHYKPGHSGKSDGYAARGIKRNGKVKIIWMHRFILGVEKGQQVDHEDGDKLNNTRANLRQATKFTNAQNRPKARRKNGTSSRFKGLTWNKRNRTWRATIMVNGRAIHIGEFFDEIGAAKAYDKAARQYHGEFARLNFSLE